jgi:hypothetical protein
MFMDMLLLLSKCNNHFNQITQLIVLRNISSKWAQTNERREESKQSTQHTARARLADSIQENFSFRGYA